MFFNILVFVNYLSSTFVCTNYAVYCGTGTLIYILEKYPFLQVRRIFRLFLNALVNSWANLDECTHRIFIISTFINFTILPLTMTRDKVTTPDTFGGVGFICQSSWTFGFWFEQSWEVGMVLQTKDELFPFD